MENLVHGEYEDKEQAFSSDKMLAMMVRMSASDGVDGVGNGGGGVLDVWH